MQHSTLRDGGAVANGVDHTLIGGSGHPSGQQYQTVQVGRVLGYGVGGQLLHPHHRQLFVPVPAGFQVCKLHRHHSLYALNTGNGVDVCLGQAQGGKHPQVKDVLPGKVFISGQPHTWGKAHQAGQHHDPQQHDAKQGDEAAEIAFEIPQDIFAITFCHDAHHSICSTGTGCLLTSLERIWPLRTWMTRSAMAVRAELWVMTITVWPVVRQVFCKRASTDLPVL